MSGPWRQRLGDGRLHFQHGPIDCIVAADGERGAVAACEERAWQRFGTVLDELIEELPLLRSDLAAPGGAGSKPHGAIARRMVAACRAAAGLDGHEADVGTDTGVDARAAVAVAAHAAAGPAAAARVARRAARPVEQRPFISAMAAVAGSVAEELVGCFDDARVTRASINNGGDIALRLRAGTHYRIGLFADPAHGLAGLPLDGRFTIGAESGVRGIATSGWRGRSFSRGIADAVTVLARTASLADAAATLIANAVDVDAPGIVRRPADAVRDDSDLGHRLVTCAVPALAPALVATALGAGRRAAERLVDTGTIVAAVLVLQGRWRVVDAGLVPTRIVPKPFHHREALPC